MVPLADLFNHKTGAEDVHFTSISSHLVHENDCEDNQRCDEFGQASGSEDLRDNDEHEYTCDNDQLTQNSQSSKDSPSSACADDPTVLEMIMVKEVKKGAEVFNTYGSLGNAALLHRYGFAEADNPFDIVNIDLELVFQWSLSLFSNRHRRMRLSLWRRLDYSGCFSQNSEYFEISSNGEPQVELLILIYIILLPEESYYRLELTISTAGNLNESLSVILPKGGNIVMERTPEMSKDLLLTKSVREALVSLANLRESLYGSNSVDDDIEALKRCCNVSERKLYNSLLLRVSERNILEKLRAYAAASGRGSGAVKSASMRKKIKRA